MTGQQIGHGRSKIYVPQIACDDTDNNKVVESGMK